MAYFEKLDDNKRKAVLFQPDRNDPASTQLFEEVFGGSGVASWARERTGKYAEFITPRKLYLAGPNMQHRVVWVYHQGMTGIDQDNVRLGYAEHHVVCDCAVEINEPEPHPNNIVECEYVQEVLSQRARDLAREQFLDHALHLLSEFDVEQLGYRLSPAGQAVAIRALVLLLENDRRRPEEWMANEVSGLHHINLLATYLGLDESDVIPLLEMMEGGGIININEDTIKLAA